MFKKFTSFLIIFFITGVIYAQPVVSKILYSDFIQLPTDSSETIYYTYKIPLNHLVFEKESDLFLAQYRLSLEVFDSANQKFITRAIKEKNIQVADYEQTNSSYIFSEGVLELNLNPGIYSVTEILYDYKSNKEFKLPSFKEIVDSNQRIVYPIIVSTQQMECNSAKSSVLSNYGGHLPFDENEYTFVIPVKNPKPDSLFVTIIQNKDTLYSRKIERPEQERIKLNECGGKLVIDEIPGVNNYSIFKISGVSNKIKEGPFLIIVSVHSDDSNPEKLQLKCDWIDKPRSLVDPEIAIKALKFIEKDSIISSLLSADDEKYGQELATYWKKIDPTPNTEFNPLMQEYYLRIDYAVKNFNSIGGLNGANTDRGKVYIKFGKPIDIIRASDDHGNIIETWTYNNPQRKFVFIDKKGTGEFSLING